jgi:hypothetical protein
VVSVDCAVFVTDTGDDLLCFYQVHCHKNKFGLTGGGYYPAARFGYERTISVQPVTGTGG